jgi:hypothetical protein
MAAADWWRGLRGGTPRAELGRSADELAQRRRRARTAATGRTPRWVAYDVLRAVHTSDAYANLLLPRAIARRAVRRRRRSRHRARVRHPSTRGNVRRDHRGCRRSTGLGGRPCRARRAAARCAPAARDAHPVTRRSERDRSTGAPGSWILCIGVRQRGPAPHLRAQPRGMAGTAGCRGALRRRTALGALRPPCVGDPRVPSRWPRKAAQTSSSPSSTPTTPRRP